MRPVVPIWGLSSSTLSTEKSPWKRVVGSLYAPLFSHGVKSTLTPAWAATPAAELVPHQLPDASISPEFVLLIPATVLAAIELPKIAVPLKSEPNGDQT